MLKFFTCKSNKIDDLYLTGVGAGRRAKVSGPGYTMIEVLVVLTVLAVLIALILPAIQAARESARRAQCLNNLKQLGVAMGGFQSAMGHFPPASPPDNYRVRGRVATSYQISPHVLILAQLDLAVLYNSINFNLPSDDGNSAENGTVAATRIASFLCPSESSIPPPGRFGPNSYRADLGPSPYIWNSDTKANGGPGAFPIGYVIGPNDFPDGLSQTVFMAEKLMGSGQPSRFVPNRDYWCLGIVTKPFPSTQALIESCSNAPSGMLSFCDNNGASWYIGSHDTTWFNHTVTPNSTIPGCKIDPCPDPADSSNSGGIFGASSDHSNGANILLGDGSVKFVRDTINAIVWRHLSTRSGGEAISSEAY